MHKSRSRNMLISLSALVLLTSAFVAGQRPSFAGTRPIGFPETPNRTTTTPDPLGNRFGDDRLPIEANGDRDLIDRLSKLPLDKQPFWFINWQALEELRKNPQTYPHRPSGFVDNIPLNSNSGISNNRITTLNPGFISTNTASIDRFTPTTISNQAFFNANGQSANANANSNVELGNRNGFVQNIDTLNSNANTNSNLGNRNGFVQTTDPPSANSYANSNVDIGNRNGLVQTIDPLNGNANANLNLGNRNGFEQTTVPVSTNANSNVDLGNKNGFVQITPPLASENVASTDHFPGYNPQGNNQHKFSHSHSYFYHTSSSHYQENKFHF